MPRAEGVATAIHAAVAAIYFADSSDYSLALWDVVRSLDPEVAELMENDEDVAYWVTNSEEPDDDVDDQTVAKVRAFRESRHAPADAAASCAAVGHVVVGHVTLPCSAPDCPHPAPVATAATEEGDVAPADTGGDALAWLNVNPNAVIWGVGYLGGPGAWVAAVRRDGAVLPDHIDAESLAHAIALAGGPALTPPAGENGEVDALQTQGHAALSRLLRGPDDNAPGQKVAHTLDALAAQAREAEGIAFMCPGDGPLPARVAAAIHEVQERAGRAERKAEGLRARAETCRQARCDGWQHAGALSADVTRLAAERDALRVRVAELEEEMESARRAMEKNATRLDRVSTYAIKHGPDVSVTKALAGICEDLTVHAIRLANLLARGAETGGSGE